MKVSVKQIVFTEVNTAKLLDMGELDLDSINDGQVVVKTEISSISNGTEKANITGSNMISICERTPTAFPRYLGYSSSGVVVKVGKGVTSVKEGDSVVVFDGYHKNYNVMPERKVVKVPSDQISFNECAISYISTFPLGAVRKTEVELGESAMVMGLGILGQCAVKYFKIAGAVPVIAVDPIKERREQALKSGADYVFDPTEPDFAKKVIEITKGGVNACVEVTGLGIGLNQALDCMAKYGRVALLGCTRDKNFTVDYYRKVHGPGIKLIGAHTAARPIYESSHAYFTTADDIRSALKLIQYGRLELKDLLKEVHSPKECEKVYLRLATDKNFPLCVQFDWNKL